MIVLGIHTPSNGVARAAGLREKAGTSVLGISKVQMVGDYLTATVQAIDRAGKGEIVAVGGCLDDVIVPAEHLHAGVGIAEWTESWLAYLQEHHIPFVALQSAQPRPEQRSVASVIRAYHRAAELLRANVRKLQDVQRRDQRSAEGGYICGRPPYGYSVENGTFVVNERQAKAVRFIFEQVRAGKSFTSILERLQKDFRDSGVIKGKTQYWDRVKVRRILNHRRLYCLGLYTGGRGQPVKLPGMAFLPRQWESTILAIGRSSTPVPTATEPEELVVAPELVPADSPASAPTSNTPASPSVPIATWRRRHRRARSSARIPFTAAPAT